MPESGSGAGVKLWCRRQPLVPSSGSGAVVRLWAAFGVGMAESSTYWIQDSASGRLRKGSSAGVSPASTGFLALGRQDAGATFPIWEIEIQHKGQEETRRDLVFLLVSATLSFFVYQEPCLPLCNLFLVMDFESQLRRGATSVVLHNLAS